MTLDSDAQHYRYKVLETTIPFRNAPLERPVKPSPFMHRSARIASPQPDRSRGIVLFVALLVMVALSIAGVALMRSTDAAIAVTGNLVLKQAASLAGGSRRRAGGACDLGGGASAGPHPALPRRRISTRACAATRAAAWSRTASFRRFPISSGTSPGARATGLATGLIANDDAGNRSCYVIERMCLAPGPAIRSNCNLATGALGADPGTEHYVGLTRPGDAYYRVTVRSRVRGTR